jgi:hypothetical protein
MATAWGDRSCVDPLLLREQCLLRDLPLDPWWGKANRFEVPLGKGPGRGHILLKFGDIADLGTTSDQTLAFRGTDADHVYRLQKITLVAAQCVSPGYEGDPAGTFLCELVDRRFHLAKIPLDKAYNVYAADGSGYLSSTKNGGSAWTWAQILTDITGVLGISTGALPFTPHSTPENLTYWGSFAWDALCDFLDRIACAVKYDPEADTFTVVRLGSTDTTAENAMAGLVAERTWDGYPEDPSRAWRPEKVRVKFLRRPRPTDGSTPYYTKDITLAATAGVVSGSYVQLDDDLTALGATGAPSNQATLDARAQERADDWLRKRSGYERRLAKVYRDFVPDAEKTILGKTVGRVGFDDRGGPMRTEVVARPDGLLEKWQPLSPLPPWFPASSGGSPSFDFASTTVFDGHGGDYDMTAVAVGTFQDVGCSLTLLAGWNFVSVCVSTAVNFSVLGTYCPGITARFEWDANTWPDLAITGPLGFRGAVAQQTGKAVDLCYFFGRWINVGAGTTLKLTCSRQSSGATWTSGLVLQATELHRVWVG